MKFRHFIPIAAASLAAHAAEPLSLVHTIPLPGVHGRFDHFACDPAGKMLIVAALGNNTGEVFDLAENKHLRSITGLRKPTGALILSDPHRLYFANGDDGSFRAFEPTTFAPASQLSGLDDADNVRFDAAAKLIYVGCGEGFIDVIQQSADQYERTARIPTRPGARTSFFSVELDRLYLAVPERNGHDAELRVYQP